MHCSGCGKNVPFNGVVCPYCHRDKSNDKNKKVISVLFGFIGALIGIGVNGFVGMFVGLVIGVIIGSIVGLAKLGTKTIPPEVRVTQSAVIYTPASSIESMHFQTAISPNITPPTKFLNGDVGRSDVSTRLRHLESLRAESLISEVEFAAKRQDILAHL